MRTDGDRVELGVESILPEQWFNRAKQGGTGERRMMLAMLTDAVDCYMKYAWAIDPLGRETFNEASEWLFSTDDSWAFSMETVCRTLDIEPDYIRRGLTERRARYLTAAVRPGWRALRQESARAGKSAGRPRK